MFFNRCDSQINKYAKCVNLPDWKANINQFISEDKKRECFSVWNTVKNCSNKNLGRDFTMKLDMMRNLEQRGSESENEAKSIQQYNLLIKNQLQFLKEDMPVAGEDDE